MFKLYCFDAPQVKDGQVLSELSAKATSVAGMVSRCFVHSLFCLLLSLYEYTCNSERISMKRREYYIVDLLIAVSSANNKHPRRRCGRDPLFLYRLCVMRDLVGVYDEGASRGI